MTLKARDEAHIARRIWHFTGVFSMFVFYLFVSPRQALIAAVVISSTLITIDVTRLYVARFNRFWVRLFKKIIREDERNRLSGITFMMAGVTLIVALYPKNVVLLTLLFVSLADPMASEFGVRFGKDKLIGNKSLQGSLAAFVTCFLLSMGFFRYFGLVQERAFIVCLLAALIGALAELTPVGKLDDNFVFPVVNATLLTLLLYVFGGL